MSDYTVGYKRPPPNSRFKPNNREHLKRQNKRKAPKEGTILREVLNRSVQYRDGGKTKHATRMELVIKSYIASALKGDVGAVAMLLKIHAEFGKFGDINPAIIWISEEDARL